MNSIIIELDNAVVKVYITKEEKKEGFITYVSDKRIEDLITNFGNNIITSYSVQNIDGKENIVFKESNNNSLTFVIQDENQDLGLDYINYLIDKYNEIRKNFYEREKEVRNINIALSTTSSYYEKIRAETVNYVLNVNNNQVSIEDLNFASFVLEELVFNTCQNVAIKEQECIILIGTDRQIITLPKILFLKLNSIIKKRRKLRKLAFGKKEY